MGTPMGTPGVVCLKVVDRTMFGMTDPCGSSESPAWTHVVGRLLLLLLLKGSDCPPNTFMKFIKNALLTKGHLMPWEQGIKSL